jgi:hypothetical protein
VCLNAFLLEKVSRRDQPSLDARVRKLNVEKSNETATPPDRRAPQKWPIPGPGAFVSFDTE